MKNSNTTLIVVLVALALGFHCLTATASNEAIAQATLPILMVIVAGLTLVIKLAIKLQGENK